MRKRYTLNLYTENPKEAEFLDYLTSISSSAKRGEEIRRLALYGFQRLIVSNDHDNSIASTMPPEQQAAMISALLGMGNRMNQTGRVDEGLLLGVLGQLSNQLSGGQANQDYRQDRPSHEGYQHANSEYGKKHDAEPHVQQHKESVAEPKKPTPFENSNVDGDDIEIENENQPGKNSPSNRQKEFDSNKDSNKSEESLRKTEDQGSEKATENDVEKENLPQEPLEQVEENLYEEAPMIDDEEDEDEDLMDPLSRLGF